jgi:hypothetical protein
MPADKDGENDGLLAELVQLCDATTPILERAELPRVAKASRKTAKALRITRTKGRSLATHAGAIASELAEIARLLRGG